MPFDTLEAAQAEIVRLTEENTRLTNERDTFSQQNADLTAEMGEVRKLNQSLLLKVTTQVTDNPEPEQEETVLSCEEFAKTLDGIV